MYKSSFLALTIATAVLCGCSSVSTQDTAADVAAKEQSQSFLGSYHAVLPCASCEGIDLTVKLNADTTYELKAIYLGSAAENHGTDFAFDECGVYQSDGKIITLTTPSSGNQVLFKLMDDGNILRMSDDGSEPESDMRELYILKKTL